MWQAILLAAISVGDDADSDGSTLVNCVLNLSIRRDITVGGGGGNGDGP